jgi:hypothetical protein
MLGLMGLLGGGGFGGGMFPMKPPMPGAMVPPMMRPPGVGMLPQGAIPKMPPAGMLPKAGGMPSQSMVPPNLPLTSGRGGYPGEIAASAQRMGIDPVDYATALSYETKGTFDPWIKGPTTKWGEHRGIMQMGGPQRKQYGYAKDNTPVQNVAAMESYMVDNGLQPGMGQKDIYSIINAGEPGRYTASDRPGWNVNRHVDAMQAHRPIAQQYLASAQNPLVDQLTAPQSLPNPTQMAMAPPPQLAPQAPGPQLASAPMPQQVQARQQIPPPVMAGMGGPMANLGSGAMPKPPSLSPQGPEVTLPITPPPLQSGMGIPGVQPLGAPTGMPPNLPKLSSPMAPGNEGMIPQGMMRPPPPQQAPQLPMQPPPMPLRNPMASASPPMPTRNPGMPPPMPARNPMAGGNPMQAATYALKAGENPWAVAQRLGIPFHLLMQMNPMSNAQSRRLPIGHQLQLPRGY